MNKLLKSVLLTVLFALCFYFTYKAVAAKEAGDMATATYYLIESSFAGIVAVFLTVIAGLQIKVEIRDKE
jgi:hypothetical protein